MNSKSSHLRGISPNNISAPQKKLVPLRAITPQYQNPICEHNLKIPSTKLPLETRNKIWRNVVKMWQCENARSSVTPKLFTLWSSRDASDLRTGMRTYQTRKACIPSSSLFLQISVCLYSVFVSYLSSSLWYK